MNATTIYLIAHFVRLEAIAKCFVGGEIHAGLDPKPRRGGVT